MKKIESIKLYEPIMANELKQYERIIGSVLFNMSDYKMGNLQYWFDNNGHLNFVDSGKLLSEEPFPCAIKDSKAAREIVETYMKESNKKFKEYFVYKRPGISQIFPSTSDVSLKPLSITPIIHTKTNKIDHWLCKYFLLLKPGFKESVVPVFNSEIQFRVGGKGNIIGLLYYWRPILNSRDIKKFNLFIEAPQNANAPLLASLNRETTSNTLVGKTYNPYQISEPPQLAYYYEEGSSSVAPYFLGFSELNQIFVPACEYSKPILPQIDFTPPYDKLKRILEKFTGVRFPELPSDSRLMADWQALYSCWFFETKPEQKGGKWTSDVEVEFDYTSPYSTDIKNSVSMKKIKENFMAIESDRPNPFGPKPYNGKSTGFTFNGPETGIPNYYSWVEWFIGSYDVTIDWTEVSQNTFSVDILISNKSGWYSGTRLPKTWQDKIKELSGIEMTNLVDDAPRGETVKRKLHPFIVSAVETVGFKIPSFGGNFWQYFHIKDTWKK
jgi:hypothetical protein